MSASPHWSTGEDLCANTAENLAFRFRPTFDYRHMLYWTISRLPHRALDFVGAPNEVARTVRRLVFRGFPGRTHQRSITV
jgi:hypothetical protein